MGPGSRDRQEQPSVRARCSHRGTGARSRLPCGIRCRGPERLGLGVAPQTFSGSTWYLPRLCFSSSFFSFPFLFSVLRTPKHVSFLRVARMPYFCPRISSMHDSLHPVLRTGLQDKSRARSREWLPPPQTISQGKPSDFPPEPAQGGILMINHCVERVFYYISRLSI